MSRGACGSATRQSAAGEKKFVMTEMQLPAAGPDRSGAKSLRENTLSSVLDQIFKLLNELLQRPTDTGHRSPDPAI
jgi:hypothetical protein